MLLFELTHELVTPQVFVSCLLIYLFVCLLYTLSIRGQVSVYV